VKKWIADDVSNQKYFDQFKLIWDSSKQLAAQSTVDENKAWQKFQSRIHIRNEAIPLKKKFPWMRIAAAAALLISVGLITYLLLGKQGATNEREILAQQTVVNDTLPDGSMVTLNKRAFLFYKEKPGKTREVRLKGEAFFNVVPDKKKPFIIQANDVIVTVVGTSFYVKAGNGITEIVVETGIVQVTRNDKTIELRPGEKTTVSDSDSILVEKEVTDKLHNYYRSKEFVCDNTPLWKLVEVLNEAYDTNIVIANDELKDLRLNVPFINESLDQVLNVVSLTLRIKVTRDGDQIILQ
jgi:transmembrane sensor